MNGELVSRLDPRLVSLLKLLVDHRGELVSKEVILETVWAETTVAKDTVAVAIYELRKAFGDDARQPRYLETVPKRGYRLIAKVEALEPADPLESQERPHRPVRFVSWPRLALLAAVCLLATAAALRYWPGPVDSDGVVVAVLPFENHSATEHDYLATGVADTLIADLSRVSGVSVLAHRSSRELATSDASALARLGVTHVVTGSVIRHEARLRVNVGLSRRGRTTYDWSDTYEGPVAELLSLQRQVAISIATALDHELNPNLVSEAREVPPAAMQAYLLGRHFWNQRDPESVRKSVRFFDEALEADPSFARAWAGLADAHTFPGPSHLELTLEEGYRRALAAAIEARRLEPDLAEAYISSGAVRFVYEWDVETAETDFERALRLAPSSALAHQWYGELLSATGRHDRAVAHMREARRLDPRSVAILFDLFWVQYMADDLPSAVDTLDRTIELSEAIDELDPTLFWSKAHTLARLDRMDAALDSLAQFYESTGAEPPDAVRALEADPSLPSFRRFRIEALQDLADNGQTYPLSLAGAYADAGMTREALHWLERAAEQRDGAILWIAVDPNLESLHQEQRFQELVAQIGVSGI